MPAAAAHSSMRFRAESGGFLALGGCLRAGWGRAFVLTFCDA